MGLRHPFEVKDEEPDAERAVAEHHFGDRARWADDAALDAEAALELLGEALEEVDVPGAGPQFYLSNSWDNPPFDTSLNVPIPANGGIQYTCEYTVDPTLCGDPTDSCCFTFGPHSPTQEHCNAFVYFYPLDSTSVNCF